MAWKTEEPATVTLRAGGERELTVSALFQRDPHYLRWNRILILGDDDLANQIMMLQGHGPVHWEVHNREDWPGSREIGHRRSGSGFIRSSGIAQGVTIADGSIQPVAELEIYESIDTMRRAGNDRPTAEFWFLQRSRNWPVYRNPFAKHPQSRVTGRWMHVRTANIRFRLLSTDIIRDEPRISRELEKLILPGVEIEPLPRDQIDREFQSKAEALWFTLRVLLMFGLREFVSPLVEKVTTAEVCTSKWHSVEVQPRTIKTEDFEHHYPHLFEFLPAAAPRLYAMADLRELMHAAAHGYATSFHARTLEGGLSSCVQGVERLVTAFEATRNLDRELIDRAAWKPVAKSLKDHVQTLDLRPTVKASVKRSISMPLRLSLQERIERMANCYRRTWDKATPTILRGLSHMIKARNDIVHGRMIADANITYIERLRARALFEQLFLRFLGCSRVNTSTYAAMELDRHYGTAG
jgi:hypothetical protein